MTPREKKNKLKKNVSVLIAPRPSTRTALSDVPASFVSSIHLGPSSTVPVSSVEKTQKSESTKRQNKTTPKKRDQSLLKSVTSTPQKTETIQGLKKSITAEPKKELSSTRTAVVILSPMAATTAAVNKDTVSVTVLDFLWLLFLA